jgi:hypothetical protein
MIKEIIKLILDVYETEINERENKRSEIAHEMYKSLYGDIEQSDDDMNMLSCALYDGPNVEPIKTIVLEKIKEKYNIVL